MSRAPAYSWRSATGGIVLFLLLILSASAWGQADPRVVRPSPVVDADGDRISDFLAAKVPMGTFSTVGPRAGQVADLIVALDHPPGPADTVAIAAVGGQVLGSWSQLVYAARVALPVTDLNALLRVPGVVLIEENGPCQATLYLGTRQARGRQVWSAPYGYEGDTTHNIAILDTGLDDSHPDFASKIIAWYDEVGPDCDYREVGYYVVPVDNGEHGSHVGGIAAGLGAAAGIVTGVGSLPITDALFFPPSAWSGWLSYFPVDTTGAGGNSTITSKLKWDDVWAGHAVYVDIRNSGGSTLASDSAASIAAQPLIVSYSSLPSGITNYVYQNLPYQSKDNNSAYWVQANTPMTAVGDGYNLMRGMAPGANLAGVKVLDDNGNTYLNIVVDGLSWVVSNKATYQMVVVNLSLGGYSVVSSLDTAVNNATAAGIVVCCSAGNSRGDLYPYIYSPGSASKAVTVAAVSEQDRITSYSSYGDTGDSKPDIAAPGGSHVTGRAITSVDSNDDDFNYNPSTGGSWHFLDTFINDYKNMSGTSMSCPYVAGAVALVAQAMGPWGYTEDEALRVKMYLGMTATETNQTAEASPNPTLDRGAKDVSEGFGRINTDAAIEAVTMSYTVGSAANATLGSDVTEKKCWARQVYLASGITYTLTLTNPGGADYDLYLYQDAYTNDASTSLGSIGDPIIEQSSCTAAAGGTEQIAGYSPASSDTFYLVVKRVSGSGQFTLNSTGPTEPDDSEIVSETIPDTMLRTQELSVTVTVRNMGINTWTQAGGYALSSVNPDDNTTWGLNRVQLDPADSIATGQTKEFTFTITAPDTISTGIDCDWQMIQEGVARFGETSTNSVGVHTFSDVPPTIPYWCHVEAAYRQGIMTGSSYDSETRDRIFSPDGLVTRKTMAQFLCRAEGKDKLNSPTPTFNDVFSDNPYYGWIERLADSDSWYDPGNPCLMPPTAGCGSNPPYTPPVYCPNDTVTRAQMAVFICRAKGKCKLNSPTPTFADVPAAVAYYGFVERLADPGSWPVPPTSGCATNPRRFCPNDECTRAMMAVFLVRAWEHMCDDTVPSVTIDQPAPGASLTDTVQFQVTSATAVKVEFWVNNESEPRYTDTSAPFTWDCDTRMIPGGAATVTVRAYDGSGKAGLANRNVSIDNVIFSDVPHSLGYWRHVEAAWRAGIMGECAANLFCPNDDVYRKNMAEFVCKAAGKSELLSPTPRFGDVPGSHPQYGWIERLADPGSWYDPGNSCLGPPTAGCGGGNYCPDNNVTRAQMAVFLCRARGKCPLDRPTPTFADVPKSVGYYGFVERLADPGSWTTPPTMGCGGGNFCPLDNVTRCQMAVFLARAYDLPL